MAMIRDDLGTDDAVGAVRTVRIGAIPNGF